MKNSKKLLPLCLVALTLPDVAWAVPSLSVTDSQVPAVRQQKGRVVTGTITDAVDGTTIIGANILLKGTTTGVISDIDGHFSIPVNSSRDVLVVSYIGYKTREVPVEDLGVINIKLSSDNEVLDEVVIVGSGTQKKISVTGSISSVKGSELQIPNSSLSNALAGRVSGLISTTTSGEPGAGSNFYIRGISTFGGDATPLIMLDDVEISAGDLDQIPAENIESFSILKDASATAIYGARGANGVLLITTKSGMENSKTKVNVTVENSFLTPMNFPEFVDGATWMEMYNEALTTRTQGATLRYDPATTIANTRNGVNPYIYPDVDWGDLIFKNMTMNQRANVNIQGGGSRVTYYMSVNVNHDTGLLDSPQYYSFDSNIDKMTYVFQNNVAVKVTPTTKVRLNMNAQISNWKGPNNSTGNIFKNVLESNPINFPAFFPYNDEEGHPQYGNAYKSNSSNFYTNPYAYMATTFKQSDANTMNTTLRLEQNLDFITEGLSLNGMFHFKTYSQSSYSRTIEPYYYQVLPGSYNQLNPTDFELERLGTSGSKYISQSGLSRYSDRTITLQFQLNYRRRFGLHDVGGMLMYMQRDAKSAVLPSRNQGFSGRFTYDYGQRYLVEFNFGYNGTERLAKGDRFEFFPALSLGWVVSNEKFFKPLTSVVDNLKLRASYGLVGSDKSSYPTNFYYIDDVTLGDVGFVTGDNWNTNKKGPTVNRYAVVGAGWERSKKLDVGFDLTMFRRWNIAFDYFHEDRYNILMKRSSWPNSLGYGSATPWRNMGELMNQGVEFSTSYRYDFNKDISLDFRGNFTYARNEYVEYDEPDYPYPWKFQTGNPMNCTSGYVADGLFTSEEDIANHAVQELGSNPKVGDIKYRDLNGDGVIDNNDHAFISDLNRSPRIQYGFGLNMRWKKFDFGVFFTGSAMRRIMINGIHPFGSNDRNIFQFIADDYWSEDNPNPDAAYPRLGLVDTETANNTVNSTYWMRNGNFLRFKTAEIGYTFKYGRVYLNGDNLAVFSPFKHWDPELSWNSYPLSRTFNLGIQFNF